MSLSVAPKAALLGSRIKQARKAAGLSHDKLGARVGTSRQHLIRLEKGLHNPKPEMLGSIARETGRPLSFFEGDEAEDDEESDVASDLMRALRRLVKQAVAEATA